MGKVKYVGAEGVTRHGSTLLKKGDILEVPESAVDSYIAKKAFVAVSTNKKPKAGNGKKSAKRTAEEA